MYVYQNSWKIRSYVPKVAFSGESNVYMINFSLIASMKKGELLFIAKLQALQVT